MLHPTGKAALWVSLFALLALGATDSDSIRVRTLGARLFCDCRCHQVLTECSHGDCTRKPALIKEIAAGIRAGQTDDAVLSGMAAKYGSTILLVPVAAGFNALLWIVPGSVAVVVLIGFLMWWRKFRSCTPGLSKYMTDHPERFST